MRRSIAQLMSAAALLLVPWVAYGGASFGCCQLGETCVNGGANLFMTCPLSQGVYTPNGVCSSTPIGTCGPPPNDAGCCQLGDTCVNGSGNLFMTCPLSQGVFLLGGVCSSTPTGICGPPPLDTPTATPTSTPTQTSTPTPFGDGASCATPSQCASGFCVDGICCDDACDGPAERCDLAGREGVCVASAPAPAASGWALASMGAVLIAVAGLALRQLKR